MKVSMTIRNGLLRQGSSRRWILALLLVIGLIALGIWWSQSSSLMAKLEKSGVPLTYEDLASRPVPADGNAALMLGKIRPRLQGLPDELADLVDAAREGRLTDDQRQRADQLLASYAGELDVLDEAAGAPGYVPIRMSAILYL